MYRPLLWPCQQRCGTCRDWIGGKCFSPERIGSGEYGDDAGQTSSRDACEAWVNNGRAVLAEVRAA